MKTTLLGLALGFAIGAGHAGAETYVCQFVEHGSNQGLIPEIVVVGYDDETGEAIVSDPYIQYYLERPIKAELKKNTAKVLGIGWKISNVSGKETGGASVKLPALVYSMLIRKAPLKATINGRIAAYDNNVTATGKCTVK